MCAIDNGFSAAQVVDFVKRLGIKLVSRVARCEHDKTRDDFCSRCDSGGVFDARPHAWLPDVAVLDGYALAAVSDDGTWVYYIPARFQARMERLTSF